VASAVGGRVSGDPSLTLTGVEALDRAGPSDLSWLADAGRRKEAAASRAGALIAPSEEAAAGKPAILVDSPQLALASWLELFRRRPRPRAGVSRRANVAPSARLGRGVSVAPGATVSAGARVGARTIVCSGAFVGEGAQIGEDCYLHPHSAVLDRCRVGARCVLQAGAVVGSDGFGYAWDGERHRKIPQVGIVRLEEDVEVGACAAIDRATLGETIIGRGTKIDNLVQIGHNVVVGEHSILCGQAGVSGSSKLGRRVTLAGQAGLGDHVSIGDGAIVTGQAGIFPRMTVPPGTVISGMPPAPHREFLRRSAIAARLPELLRRLEKLEARIASLEKGGVSWKSESPKS
jgi:UDP-3-O-[3-hydroxymyristoyl] glucosamine N-acyltransferase